MMSKAVWYNPELSCQEFYLLLVYLISVNDLFLGVRGQSSGTRGRGSCGAGRVKIFRAIGIYGTLYLEQDHTPLVPKASCRESHRSGFSLDWISKKLHIIVYAWSGTAGSGLFNQLTLEVYTGTISSNLDLALTALIPFRA